MKVGVLGSGDVAKALAGGFVKHAHDVMIGTRTPAKLMDWGKKNPQGRIGSIKDLKIHVLGNLLQGANGRPNNVRYERSLLTVNWAYLGLHPHRADAGHRAGGSLRNLVYGPISSSSFYFHNPQNFADHGPRTSRRFYDYRPSARCRSVGDRGKR